MSPFVLGQTVRWLSHASGRGLLKSGTIVAIVPTGQYPYPIASALGSGYSLGLLRGFGQPRSEETYLVAVKTGRSKPKLYWPRVSKLAIVSTSETEAA